MTHSALVRCTCDTIVFTSKKSVACPVCKNIISFDGYDAFVCSESNVIIPILVEKKFLHPNLNYFYEKYPENEEIIYAISSNNIVKKIKWSLEIQNNYENDYINSNKNIFISWTN